MHSFYKQLEKFDIVLGSGSPRRHQLLTALGIPHRIVRREPDENFPGNLKREQIALYLAEKKSAAYVDLLPGNHSLVITADTIVCLGDQLIGKPRDRTDAQRMLRLLSGKMHEVFTGVCLAAAGQQQVFYAASKVYFKKLTEGEIDYYIETGKPFDKAGAYGVQDWFGLTAIERIDGSFYNVMGLPTRELYEKLPLFF